MCVCGWYSFLIFKKKLYGEIPSGLLSNLVEWWRWSSGQSRSPWKTLAEVFLRRPWSSGQSVARSWPKLLCVFRGTVYVCVCAGAGVCVSALCRDPGRLAPPTHLWHLPLGPPLFRIPSRRFSTTTTTPSPFLCCLFFGFCFNRNCGFLRIARTGKRESLSLSGRSTTLPRCFFVLF